MGTPPDLLELDPPKLSPARQLLWMKIREPIGSSSGRLDESCAAYLSDQPLLVTALLPHGLQFPSPKLGAIATLDHSMWFHRPFKADEWLLYEMTSPHASSGLALSFGHLYRMDTRELVVTCAQQGMLRLAKPSATTAVATTAMWGANLLRRARSLLASPR